jgi:hypothetical protein
VKVAGKMGRQEVAGGFVVGNEVIKINFGKKPRRR